MRSSNQNRRKYPRADIAVKAEVRYGGATESLCVSTKNVGAGGVCIVLPDLVSVGTEVAVTLHLPDKLPSIEVAGEVAWAMQQRRLLRKKDDSFETGIKFTNIEPAERDRIIRLASEFLY